MDLIKMDSYSEILESILAPSSGLNCPDLPDLPFETVEEHLNSNVVKTGPPDRTPMTGEYNFAVEIDSTNIHRRKYLFSHKLNCIYVNIDIDFAVQFSWRGPPTMIVRAMCVFADDAQAQKRVQRCKQHFPDACRNTPEEVMARNVLLSSRPGGTSSVYYEGAPAADDSWLSVCVRLHCLQGKSVGHAYRFACKNSCASGINRRATLIIFTLEDEHGKVYGRQLVGARVCSCPRRDMQKDEETEGAPKNKRRATVDPLPPPTKVKREDCADWMVDLTMLNPQAAILGLEVMIKMEQQADTTRSDPRSRDVVARLAQIRDDMKSKYPAE